MKDATIRDTAKARFLTVNGDFQAQNLEATEATISGRTIIKDHAQVESLTLRNGTLEIGEANLGRLITYNGNVDLGDVTRLDSIVFANDPDTYWEVPQKYLRILSAKFPEKIAIILDKGKNFLNTTHPKKTATKENQ